MAMPSDGDYVLVPGGPGFGLGGYAAPPVARGWYAQMHEPHKITFSRVEEVPVTPMEQDGFVGLERERSDLAWIARFSQRVDYATFYLCGALEMSDVRDFGLSQRRNIVRASQGVGIWYATIVNSTFNRYRTLRSALVHEWTPPAQVEPLAFLAFSSLCTLTPAEHQLRALVRIDRARAFRELVKHLDIVADQLELTVRLAANLEVVRADETSSEDEARLDAIQTEILARAGEALGLRKAAQRLGITRQALHKRIRSGSALGVMRGSELVVPSAQFVERDGSTLVVGDLKRIMRIFDDAGAGAWSALQFLTEPDPLLKDQPLSLLKRGNIDEVVTAARGFLGLEEG